jgi:phospholipid/cholesterol/gamma-HCH transport system ATP-binding protein
MTTNDFAVEIRGVAKTFGALEVYRDLDLQARRGETLAVLGPSGSGKSVLLKLIMGLLKPDGGRVIVDGVDVTDLDEHALRTVRRRVGMLFQGAALFDSMTVGDNVAYGLYEHFFWPRARVEARVAECLDAVGLPGTERMWPSALSGGMRKRVGLARAIAPGPDLMLYDEPTTGLDPANARRINALIGSIKEKLGATSLVITHDIDSAFAVSDRIGLVTARRIPLVIGIDEARSAPPPPLSAFVRGEL